MLKNTLLVGFGGFIGSVLRYLTTLFVHKIIITNFPLGTLIINLIGCFIIGIFYGLFDKGNLLSPNLRIFLSVGLCGGFTTFSNFSNDTINLVNDSELLYLMLYMGLSIFAGISMTFLGKSIINYLWS
ncbi:MAG: fluoride efflux transporter CrcB [Bacteroidetes bacterium]|nr:MAG: fluoride efflux transporter CrcB [Bacteroidota bacterium]